MKKISKRSPRWFPSSTAPDLERWIHAALIVAEAG